MKLADRLTLSRIVLAPAFVALFFALDAGQIPVVANLVLLWILFVTMEATDVLDGWVARKKQGVSDFGKVFDPFADVIAHLSFIVALSFAHVLPIWFLLVVIYREFGISFLRLLLMGKGISMGARPGGKIKSFLYMLTTGVGLLLVSLDKLAVSLDITSGVGAALAVLSWLAAAMAVLSFVDYLIQFRKIYRP